MFSYRIKRSVRPLTPGPSPAAGKGEPVVRFTLWYGRTSGLATGSSAYGYADFVYGAATSVFQNSPISSWQYKWTPFLYFQDDWRVSRKLTLNLGLRYDFATPPYSGNNKLENFNPAGSGSLEFASSSSLGDRSLVQINKTNFAPRFGFAYSPVSKTVIRGGYGIYYEPLGVTNVQVNQTGFNSSTAFVGTLDNGLTYIANLTNPYPNGLSPAPGAAAPERGQAQWLGGDCSAPRPLAG